MLLCRGATSSDRCSVQNSGALKGGRLLKSHFIPFLLFFSFYGTHKHVWTLSSFPEAGDALRGGGIHSFTSDVIVLHSPENHSILHTTSASP